MDKEESSSSSSSSSSSTSSPQRQLPTALQLHILSLLPPNDRALNGRLMSPDAHSAFCGPQHCTAYLFQPLLPHAVPWAVAAGQQRARQLPFRHKLQLMCTAAASGCAANLEVALALLQPSIFRELLQQRDKMWVAGMRVPCPGCAAIKAGHLEVLSWLLRHCPGLVDPQGVLRAAAQYGSLADLQAAWAVLQSASKLDARVFDSAARSSTADAVAKIEWVLDTGGASFLAWFDAACAAAESGDLGRLRWLRDRGCRMINVVTLRHALEFADLAMADWLVDEAGCNLPRPGSDCREWFCFLDAAAKGPDGASKLQWLQDRGCPVQDMDSQLLVELARAIVRSGHVGTLRHLQSARWLGSIRLQESLRRALAMDTPGSIEMARRLKESGITFAKEDYLLAASNDNVPMLRWLALEAGVSAAGLEEGGLHLVYRGPYSKCAADSRDLLEAAQLMVGAGFDTWDVGHAVAIAAGRGSMALVQYLLQQRPQHVYRADWKAVAAGAAGGCEELLEWLVEQLPGGVDGDERNAKPYIRAALNGDLCTLTALRRLGVPWGAEDVVVQAVRAGCCMPVLWWLVEQGAPVGSAQGMEAELAIWRISHQTAKYDNAEAAWLGGLAGASA